jgi:tRNA(adenine34) deaminase
MRISESVRSRTPCSATAGIAGSETLMRAALAEARRGADEGEVPVGAVVAIGDRLIAAAHNRPIALNDPTAHAEVLALREAGRALGNYRMPDATLYVTVEPCVMCCGAIVNARLARVVFGAADPKAGAVESLYRLLGDARLNHEVAVTAGVLAEECAALLREFFMTRRT